MRLQRPEHQLYFAKTPILDLGTPTPKDYNQLPSSNLDFSEAPTSKAPTLFCQDTNLGLRSTNSQGLQSCLVLRLQPLGLQSNLTSEAPASRTPILLASEAPTPGTPILLVSEAQTPRTPILLAFEAPTPRTPILLAFEAPAPRTPIQSHF